MNILITEKIRRTIMKFSKKAVATSLFAVAFTGFGLASNAQAYPGEAEAAPDSSIQHCDL